MPYHIEPAAELEGEAAERFIDIIKATKKGSVDFSEEKASAEKILENSKVSIFDTPCINCLTCARFTNSCADIFCGDLNTPISKDIIRKGCDSWKQKGSTNWYMILTEDGFVKHELTRDEEDDILNEYYGQKCGSADHMTKEKVELAQHIKWRRVIEL